jgi:hypothetical protein
MRFYVLLLRYAYMLVFHQKGMKCLYMGVAELYDILML